MSTDALIKAYKIAEKILKGEAPSGAYAFVWDANVKRRFMEWLEAQGRTRDYILDCARYLDRYVVHVEDPSDVVEAFARCERGKPHLVKAFRALAKYYQVVEKYPEDFVEGLLKAVPKARTGEDVREVEEEAVLETFRALEALPANLHKYRLLWTLMLDSGTRLSHAVQLMGGFDPARLVRLEGFCRYSLGIEREVKHTWFAYMRTETAEALAGFSGKVTARGAFRLMGRLREKGVKLVNPKLIRKFAYNIMLDLGFQESVADWMCGRRPATVGARHYAWLRRQADRLYPRYARYLDRLFDRL